MNRTRTHPDQVALFPSLFPNVNTPVPIKPVAVLPRATGDRLIKLRDVEAELAKRFNPASRPSRNTIIGWCEDGTLTATQIGRGRNYYVTESSFAKLVRRLDAQTMEMAA